MKVNIKGLVFTGFAAAILSANAMAAGENIVTSKSYVDAKIHDGEISASETEKAPSEKSVSTALAGKQIKTTGQVYKVGYNETWASIDSAVKVPSNGSYLTKDATAQDGSVTLNVNATTDTSLQSANSGGADENKIPTAGAVKAYVDAHSAATNFVESTVNSSSTDKAPSGEAVSSALAGKQPISNSADTGTYMVGHTGETWATLGANGYVTIDTSTPATPKIKLDSDKINNTGSVDTELDTSDTDLITEYTLGTVAATKQAKDTGATYVVSKGGAWQAMTSAVTAGNDSTITVTAGTNGEAIVSAVTDSVSSGGTALVTGGDVYNYVQSMTGGTVIPTKATLCNTHPCALVNDSTGAHWRTMATAGYDGGILADACSAADTTCSLGSCNTTSGICVESSVQQGA